jgi:methyltransferase (TIGR00027 family)
MQEKRPSITAGTVAAHRAIESGRPADRRICFDPFAEQFISPRMTVIGESWLPSGLALWIYERILPGFHTYFGVRTRYLDDQLRACIQNGIEQLVLLGAGYDSRAYRFREFKTHVRAFEVDHPATQQVKLAVVDRVFGGRPPHVRYVEIDFDRQSLEERLTDAGYDGKLKTLFIWEGVSYYLSAEAVDQTLAFVADHSRPGSSILFDYTSPDVISGRTHLREGHAWRGSLQRLGEPLLFGIEEASIETYLRQRGYRIIENALRDILQSRYLAGANHHRYLTPVFSIVHAEVQPRA